MGYEFGNSSSLINGVVPAVVASNKHPDGKYMVKLNFPWIGSKDAKDKADFQSTWARVCTPMAGGGRGFYCLPEEGDEVIVSFVHGNINHPIVIGSVWNDTDKAPHGGDSPPESTDPLGNALGIADACKDNKAADGKNNGRFFISRAGSTMLFDDTDGKEKIAFFTAKGSMFSINDEKDTIMIYDHAQEVYLAMDAKNKKIKLETKNGDIDIYCKKGTFTLLAKEIVTKAEQNQTHEAEKGKWAQKSKGTMDMEAGGTMTEKAPKIDLNP